MGIFDRLRAAIMGTGAPAAEPLPLGSRMPDVSQINQDGIQVALNDTTGHRYQLVYFYPKADTPGCTRQACSLRDAFADLASHGIRVIGVSHDSPQAQKDFQRKFNIPFDLLADQDNVVSRAFGVPTTMGFPKRQAFLFLDGILTWRDLAASTSQQAADVLAVVGSHEN